MFDYRLICTKIYKYDLKLWDICNIEMLCTLLYKTVYL